MFQRVILTYLYIFWNLFGKNSRNALTCDQVVGPSVQFPFTSRALANICLFLGTDVLKRHLNTMLRHHYQENQSSVLGLVSV